MKRSTIPMLAGGILTLVAFFLPVSATPRDGVGGSLYGYLQLYVSEVGQASPTYQSEYIAASIVLFLVPVCILLLIAGGLLAFKIRRAGSIMGLSGAVIVLTFQLWTFTLGYAFFHAYTLSWNIVQLSQGFGTGFCLSVIGSLLGLIGALLGWLGQPMPERTGGQALRVAPAALLIVGGLLASVNIFIPVYQVFVSRTSLLGTISQPLNYLVLWPDLLAIVLLLVSGVVALTGRDRALLGGLVGALGGLTFRFELLYADPGLSLGLFTFGRILPYWLLVIGCLLGLVGALLGLMQQPAANARANPLAAPTLS